MRLIDADALIQKRNHAKAYGKEMYVIGQGYVMDAPTIDAVPVVRGEWIAKQKDAEYCEFACSCCDFSAGQTDQYDATEVKQFSEWFKFCPSCGAKMDGGK